MHFPPVHLVLHMFYNVGTAYIYGSCDLRAVLTVYNLLRGRPTAALSQDYFSEHTWYIMCICEVLCS